MAMAGEQARAVLLALALAEKKTRREKVNILVLYFTLCSKKD